MTCDFFCFPIAAWLVHVQLKRVCSNAELHVMHTTKCRYYQIWQVLKICYIYFVFFASMHKSHDLLSEINKPTKNANHTWNWGGGGKFKMFNQLSYTNVLLNSKFIIYHTDVIISSAVTLYLRFLNLFYLFQGNRKKSCSMGTGQTAFTSIRLVRGKKKPTFRKVSRSGTKFMLALFPFFKGPKFFVQKGQWDSRIVFLFS